MTKKNLNDFVIKTLRLKAGKLAVEKNPNIKLMQ